MQERSRFIKLAKLDPDPTPNRSLKMSELSEGLRKQVKTLIKEGKTKISDFPDEIKKKVMAEMAMPKLSSGIRGFNDKDGRFVPTGSSMGRGSSVPADKSIAAAFEIESIMDRKDKAYDKGGAYWGHLPKNPVYRAYAELPEPVEFERNGGYSDGMQDQIELFFRANSMGAARKHVKSMFPNATFIPSAKKGMEEADVAGQSRKLISIGNDDNGNQLFKDSEKDWYYVMLGTQLYRAADDVYFEPEYKVGFPYEVVPGDVAPDFGVDESISTKPENKPFQLHYMDKNGKQKSMGSKSKEELVQYAKDLGLDKYEITPKEEVMAEARWEGDYSVEDFKRDLETGPFEWPGGYPAYFIMSDGEAMSYEAAKENAEQIIDAIQTKDDTGWRVVGRDVNWEDPDLYCCQTNQRIPSAYAEPEEGVKGAEATMKEDIEFAGSEYPELQAIVDEMTETIINDINAKTEGVQSKMPYKAQWVLEELAKALQERV